MSEQLLAQIRIVLVEPAGPLNIGSVARIMKNMLLTKLIIVNPQCDPFGDEARKMAVRGLDVLENATIVANLTEALQGCHRAIATTNRYRTLTTQLQTPRDCLGWLLEDKIESALIFGPEDRGLNNLELNFAQRFISIPSNPEYSSLNLAQAVTVCAYELYQMVLASNSDLFPSSSLTSRPNSQTQPNLATVDAKEGYYRHLEAILLEIGYLYPHTAKARMEKLKRIYNRADLSAEELAMLRGMLGQIDWANKNMLNKA
jgi:tRNA/rRNA methyltransferase